MVAGQGGSGAKVACALFHKRLISRPMKEPSGSSREVGEGYKYVSLGFTFAGGIIFFMGMGFLLDRWLGWMPLLTVVGTLAGAVLSFLNIYWKLQADERQYKADHPHTGGKRKRGSGV